MTPSGKNITQDIVSDVFYNFPEFYTFWSISSIFILALKLSGIDSSENHGFSLYRDSAHLRVEIHTQSLQLPSQSFRTVNMYFLSEF